MKNLRKKMIQGFIWSSVNIFARQGLSFAIHIALARLLAPEDFGIIGMLTIFTDLSLRLQGAGLGESLIRKKMVSQAEYNFVFFYGIVVGLFCYALLYISAPLIAAFYNEPRLILITRILGFNLVLIPLRGVNRVQMVKQMDFYKIAKIEISASLFSGCLAVVFAYKGFGVWSLVCQSVCLQIMSLGLFLGFKRWIPSFHIEKEASWKLFSFGSKLMISNFIETGFRNIYNIIIGKFYSATSLGFYTQGTKLQRLPSNAVNAVIKSVSFPAFANIRNDRHRYLAIFKKNMQLLTYVNFPVLITLAAVADPLIPFLLSPKWNQTIPFFQMLVFIGMMQPLKSQFINILKVEAKGKQLIRFVLWSKLFYIMGIILTLNMGLYALVASQVIANGCELFIFCMVGKEIGYLKSDFLKDIMPNLGLALSTGGLLYTINALTSLPPFWALVMDLFVGVATYLILSFLTKNPSFMEIKKEVTSKFAK